jgi:hypothetical protein
MQPQEKTIEKIRLEVGEEKKKLRLLIPSPSQLLLPKQHFLWHRKIFKLRFSFLFFSAVKLFVYLLRFLLMSA